MIPWFLRRCHYCRWPLLFATSSPRIALRLDEAWQLYGTDTDQHADVRLHQRASDAYLHHRCWRKLRPQVNQ